jgi:hypothetical protein
MRYLFLSTVPMANGCVIAFIFRSGVLDLHLHYAGKTHKVSAGEPLPSLGSRPDNAYPPPMRYTLIIRGHCTARLRPLPDGNTPPS